ncbi:uncharacterized protein TNCV_4586781 [Trichonephila clavipes]|nr:uncharacterized protein TNCV_4586781 [Trichonephila clavipes]
MLDHLEDNIRRVIADIRPQMLEKVIENWTSRLDYIRASRGSPMPEIIFKISTKNDINSAPFISLCLDESIDTTKSARLAVFARYCVENIIKEELIAITSLLTTTKGTDICTAKRYYYKKLQVLPKLITDLDAQEKRNEEKVIDDFISIMDSLIKEFSARFSQFKELSETFKFIMYPDVISFDKLNLSQFDWLEIEELEMQLIDFQSSSIWIQKFIETRKKLELIEAERLTSNISKNTSNEILETWNSIPDAFNCLKKLAYAILTIFSSTYACESLFSEINNIKDSLRNRLTDDSNSACILLKVTSYNPDISYFSSNLQQQKSHLWYFN